MEIPVQTHMVIMWKTGCISNDASAIGKEFGGLDVCDIQAVIVKGILVEWLLTLGTFVKKGGWSIYSFISWYYDPT